MWFVFFEFIFAAPKMEISFINETNVEKMRKMWKENDHKNKNY